MYEDILHFWFEEARPEQWWRKDSEFDRRIVARFQEVHAKACRCELFAWRDNARGRLAEIIVLDQFSRNMYRESALAFANDTLALVLAQEAVHVNADRSLGDVERSFLYMPFMHSESLVIHEKAVELFTRNGIASNLDFEMQHKAVIEQFGRYPHRNRSLGRESTPAEIEFMEQNPGF